MKGGEEMIVNTMDLVSQITGSTTNTNVTASSSKNDNKTSDFENLMNEKANSGGSSDQSVSSEEDSSTSESTGTTEETVVDGEVTDAQRELMAALTMNVVTYRPVEVVEEVAVEEELELVLPTEETVLLDNQEIDIMPEEQVLVEETVVLDVEEVEFENLLVTEEAEIVLEEEILPELEVAEEVELEIDLEVADKVEVVDQDTEVEVEVESVEEEVQEETTVAVKPEQETEVVVESSNDESVEVEVQPQRVFQDVKSTPVKVAETVDTQDPEMDTQMAKIITDAYETGNKTVTITLAPEGLGTVTAQITQTVEGALQVVLQATDDLATNLLKNHISQLAQALQGTAQSVTVEVNEPTESESAGQESQQQADEDGRGGHQQKEKESEPDVAYSEDFLQQLRLGLTQFSLDLE